MQVTEETAGKSGNLYFDVNIKTSPSDQVLIRIMKKSNAAIRRKVFVDRLHKPVHITKISKSGDIYFYNAYRGSFFEDCTVSFGIDDFETQPLQQIKDSTTGYFNVKGKLKWSGTEQLRDKKDGSSERLREGIIVDETGNNIPVSIWGKSIESITPNKVFVFTHLQVKYFYGIQKLTTTKSTNIIASKDDFAVDMASVTPIDWVKLEQDEKAKSFPSVSNATIVNCEIDIHPSCTNKKCLKKITPPEEAFFSCPHCGRRLASAFLTIGFTGMIQIEKGIEDDLELTCSADVLKPLFGDDFLHQFMDKKQMLADKILGLSKKVKITYSDIKKEVSNIEMITA